MTRSPNAARQPPVDRRFAALFFASGISALAYQTVWMRMLVRVFGSAVEATATVVAVFMGGLALGALLAGRLSRTRRFTTRTYARLELGIAVSAVAATSGIRVLPDLLAAIAGAGTPLDELALLRLSLVALVLVVPAVLLGMTLPVLVDVLASDELGRPLAALYASNTAGAAAGVLGTGFIALGVLGETATVLAAAALGGAVGVIVLGVRQAEARVARQIEPRHDGDRDRRIALLGAVLGGGAALALEVIWTRLLTFVIGTSVYAFSTMIAAFLLGIVIGSAGAAPFVDRVKRPGAVVAALIAVAGAMVVASLLVYRWMGRTILSGEHLQSQLVGWKDALAFVKVGLLVLTPMAAVFGALFLFAAATYLRGPHDVERLGRLYSLNTISGVACALGAGFIAVPRLTAQGAAVVIAYVLLGAGALALLGTGVLRGGARAVPVGIILVALFAPSDNLTLDLVVGRLGQGHSVAFHAESRDMTTTVVVGEDGERHLLLNGVLLPDRGDVESGLADVPLLLHERPRNVMIVNLGAGHVLNATVAHLAALGDDWRIAVVEPVEDVIHAHSFLNELASMNIRREPHVQDHLHDARSHLLFTQHELYDVVILDGTPPLYSSGAASSYSRELVALVRTRLAPGGILAVWAPYPAHASDIWSIAHAMQLELPHLRVSSAAAAPGAMLVASASPLDVPEEALAQRERVRRLGGGQAARGLIAGFVDASLVAANLARTPPVTDDLPRIEYPLLHVLRAGEGESPRPNLHDAIAPGARP